jgi:DNA invertase Pin-like site-specific DNA recombinase
VLEECWQRRATLVIAKLDRLARNVHFISGQMESKVDFMAVDMPNAN